MQLLYIICALVLLATYIGQVRGIVLLFGGHKKINKKFKIAIAIAQCIFTLVYFAILYV